MDFEIALGSFPAAWLPQHDVFVESIDASLQHAAARVDGPEYAQSERTCSNVIAGRVPSVSICGS